MISKKEISKLVRDITGQKKEATEETLEAFYRVLYDILMSGNSVRIGELGTLTNIEVKAKDERQGVNGLTGNPQTYKAVPAHNKPSFKFSKKAKDELKERTSNNQFVK